MVSCYVQESFIVIEFSDNGSGMDEQTQQKLFEPFFTTKGIEDGTGLGLSISIEIIQKHQGELLVTSKVGEGSTFTIKLPL